MCVVCVCARGVCVCVCVRVRVLGVGVCVVHAGQTLPVLPTRLCPAPNGCHGNV